METKGLLTMEKESNITLFSLVEAEGKIQAAEQTPEIVQLAENIVSGEWHKVTNKNIVCKCIDGRNCANGIEGPNSAGGTLSLLVADDLVSQRFISADESIASGMSRLVAHLSEQGEPVGVHGDTNANEEKSGCGANDRLPEIYAMMVKKAENIRSLAESLLGPISDDVHNSIMARALERAVFSSGADVREATVKKCGEDSCETLEGSHGELVAVVNLVSGTTLDRTQLANDHGPDRQAFNIDAWAFDASARAISGEDETEIHAKVVAMAYYNFATALVLCGPKMLVGVRQ